MFIDLNDVVYVELTEVGKKELIRQHLAREDYYGKTFPWEPYTVDKDGYSKYLLHDLMSSLGHLCILGSEVPFKKLHLSSNG